MHYKTMVLELLEQHPEMHNQLRKTRTLLPTLDRYARELKASHEIWKDRLSQAKPESDPSQVASEALEMAVKDLEDCLTSQSSSGENEPLSLDAAMAFIRRHTPSE